MLEYYFVAPWCLSSYRRGPLATEADALAAWLRERGYLRGPAREVLRLLRRFNRHVEAAGADRLIAGDTDLVAEFLKQWPARGTKRAVPRAVLHVLEHLRRRGVLPMVDLNTGAVKEEPYGSLLKRYDKHLQAVRGLPETTRKDYSRSARRLLRWLQERRRARDLGSLRGSDIVEFITELAASCATRGSRNRLTSGTRVFLRFLRLDGTVGVDLARLVPKVPHWRLSSVPRHLPWERVRALVDSIDTGSPWGLRDKAVLLLIATLGMRGQDVRMLELGHISWRASEIRLPRTKNWRARALPLPHEVGSALANYILHGRPKSTEPQVILRHAAPIGPLSSPSAVGRIVARCLRRAGILSTPRPGTHLLRHSLATRLVNHGVPIKQIADLFGHSSINTTAIYSKVDLTRLAAVALPFPRES